MTKTVRFSHVESTTIATLTPSFKMSQSERNSIWYQRSELETFRTNAKNICRSIIRKRKLSSISNNKNITATTEKSNTDQSNTICTRGLEIHIDAERKKRKRCANKIIVSAQKSMKANDLATISSSMSTSARENSVVYATFDFLATCPVYSN